MSYIPKKPKLPISTLKRSFIISEEVSCDGRDFRWGRAGNHDGAGGTRISSRDFLEEIEYTKKLIEEDNEKQRVSDRNYLFDHADEEFVKKMENIRLGKETE